MHKLEVSDQHSEQDLNVIRSGLAFHNILKTGPLKVQSWSVLIRDQKIGIIAGIIAEVQWQWCYLDSVWVHPDFQDQKLGSKCIQAIEKKAADLKCKGIYLWTTDFQALGFYQKLGYQKFGTLKDRPPGFQTIFLQKEIQPS